MSSRGREATEEAARLWQARFLAGLAAAAPTGSDDAEWATDTPPVPAAVLVPIVLHESPTILLTRRTAALSRHAGQVSFPGGRIDPGDADPVAAALRETHEEIGVTGARVIGELPAHRTGTGFVITPVVGLLPPPLALAPDPREVDQVFEIPLAAVLDPAGAEWRQGEFRGRTRHFWVIPHETHHIWGATAAILVNLGRVLRGGVR